MVSLSLDVAFGSSCVGTGGNEFHRPESMKANSEVFNNSSAGVLKLSLAAADYYMGVHPGCRLYIPRLRQRRVLLILMRSSFS